MTVTMVSEDWTFCASVAVIVAFVTAVAANARQTSLVPRCVLVRRTSCHVSPAPLTAVTVLPAAVSSAATNARNSSLPDFVDTLGDTTVVLAVP